MTTWRDIDRQQHEAAGFEFDYGPLLDEILAKLPPAPLVVELGTYLGCSAVYMAQHLRPGFKLYTVDTFESYGKSRNFLPLTMANFKAAGVRDQLHVLSCRTWEASLFFDDQEVDFVWVDAAHDFVGAKSDLDAWGPKVKPGGILAGHDLSEPGVKLAVERFCFAQKKEFHVWHPEGWMSWWIQY